MYGQARSPPPLQHPRPQHPPSQLASHSPPPPPSSNADPYGYTAGGSSYQRFASPPAIAANNYNPYAPPPPVSNSAPYSHQPHQQPRQPQQWAAPSAAPAHPSARQPPPAGANGWPPAIDNFGMNDATAQIGVQFGKQALTAGQAYLDSHVVRLLPLAHLKHSFNVSNSYVVNKIRLVLFPWRHRPWSRTVERNESTGVAEGWKPPRDDINCPDLYIPGQSSPPSVRDEYPSDLTTDKPPLAVMALVTYILLSGVAAGKAGTFDPRILGQSASRAFGILLLEFVCIRLGCYLLGIGEEGTVVDLVSYEGYKFVGYATPCLFSRGLPAKKEKTDE
jgi:hypothetical protein